MKDIVLKSSTLELTLSPSNGAVTGLSSVLTGWKILDRPGLGLSFRLLVPLSEELRNNQVLGEKQKPSSVDPGADGKSVRIAWDTVESERGGRLEIGITLSIALDERQAVFSVTVDNRSPFVVENVYCPYLGDVRRPPDAEWFRTFLYFYASAQEWGLWPRYDQLRGYYGSDYPLQLGQWTYACGTPAVPFILLRSEHQGLYAGVAAPTTELVAWGTELRPGYDSSMTCHVPEADEISGVPVATRFFAVHVPFIAAGEKRALTPIVLQAYTGDWQSGTDIYVEGVRPKPLTASASAVAPAARAPLQREPRYLPVPSWAAEPHSWQQLHINSPEDELRIRFVDLPAVGRELARHGVRALQLVGWNAGGQDQGNPSHDPDPRLGTPVELRRSIGDIRDMGVKVVLFSKFTWADRATEWFRRDLHRLAIRDPNGECYQWQGWQYQTATQLLDINTKRLVPMCFLSEEYLRVCDAEFEKMVALGADGIIFDESLHHMPALLCFATGHGHRPGAPVYANDNLLMERFSRIAAGRTPEFLLAGEACYDLELEAYHLSYHRSESALHVPLSRYMRPFASLMTAVTGFNDRNMINQCLMYRYIISYEPYNFKGRLEDFPLTLAYGKRMDALRTELREYFWDGEFRDRCGAEVTVDGQPHRPYAVFVDRSNGRVGVVVCNYDATRTIRARVTVEAGDRLPRYRLVDGDSWKPAKSGVVIPPLSAAVVTGTG
jgi:hypothetical protein